MDSTLQSTKFTLSNWACDEKWAWFDDTAQQNGVQRSITLPYPLWNDMGSPSVITVTIEPGDRLNG